MDGKRDNVLRKPIHRTPIRVGVERTVLGSSHGNKVDVNPILELTKVDHHFVPTLAGSDEDCQITYKIRGYDNEEVKLRITNTNHTPPIVYERPLTREEKQASVNKVIRWNGATTCPSGPLKGKLINPMFAAYKVQLASAKKTTDALETHVIFRELKIERMSWKDAYYAVTKLAAATFPATGSRAQKVAWLQYKLNELGYYAGPVVVTGDIHMLYRAIFRYTQEHPGFPKIYEFKTLDAGAPGKSKWGWAAEWNKTVGPLAELFGTPTNPNIVKLVRALEAGENAREEVLENKEVFGDTREDSKLFVDHNIFYQNKDFSGEDAHVAYDMEFCNRAVVPLRAKALLLSRTDEDASKPGVDSPEAVGEFECEWKTFDPPEDMSVVPLPTRANVRLSSKSRAYLDTVHRKVDGKYGDPLDTQDNCPVKFGGFRQDSPTNMKEFFASMASAFPARLEDANTRFFSKANWESNSPPGILGASGAAFQASYIAGDNYVVQARLAFEKHPNARALVTIHYLIEGLKPSLKLKGIVKKGDPPRHLVAQSGKVTIWRRLQVAQVLDWGPSNYPPIDWFKVVDMFRAAHIQLIIPDRAPERLASVLDATAKDEVVSGFIKDGLANNLNSPNNTEFSSRQNQKAFNPDGLYPLPLRTLVDYENSTIFVDDNEGSSKKARFNRYTKYLEKLLDNYPTYTLMGSGSLSIRKAFDRLRGTPGVIILRTAYLPRPNWDTMLPPDVATATRAEQAAFNPIRGISTGMDYGLVFLDAGQYPRFTDEFFFSHEISHTLFGSHAFELTSKKDHDAKDFNCLMYYGNAKGNGGETMGWAMRVAPAKEYTLNLTLEVYEGQPTWDDTKKEFTGKFVSGIESRGKVSGKFRKASSTSTKEWTFSGPFDAIEKALRELKFEPHVTFKEKKNPHPTNLFVTTVLTGAGMEPKTSEGSFPLSRKFADRSAATYPFADLKLEPMNLKDTEPRFCGKCLFKLRGWKIRTSVDPGNGTAPPDPLPEKSVAYPINPKMEFVSYKIQDGKYFAQVGSKQEFVDLAPGKTDPQDPTIKLGPLRFLHEHRLSWESTDGKLSSLKGVKTREWVKFNAPTQAPPFSVGADPDQEFYMGEADASIGEGFDDHSLRLPSLICTYPLTAGTIIGEQWYQFKMPGEDWQNFPGAAFLLEKTVYQNGPNWVLKFKKTNWEEHNPTPFCFEIHYLIGKELKSKPIPMNVPYNPTPTKPHYDTGGGIILAAGTQQIGISKDAMRETNLQELERLGFLAPKPWL